MLLRKERIPELLGVLATLLLLALTGANLFAYASTGRATFHHLALTALIPGLMLLLLLALLGKILGWRRLTSAWVSGLWVGVLATAGLELVRVIGFRVFAAMPGSMPMLMGVQITGRVMVGPDLFSNLVGWADHFWNGVNFVVLYFLLFGKRSAWGPVLYALLIGTGFLLSPVVLVIGAGYFGDQFGLKFAVTVYLAHLLFGLLIAWLQKYSSAPCEWLGGWVWSRLAKRSQIA
jgi:hypothetical protein